MKRRFLDVLELAERSSKPRETGLTMISETSTEFSRVKDLLEAHGEFIDLVEVNIGLVLGEEAAIRKKIDLFREHGIEICPAGQYCQIAHYEGRMKRLLEALKEYGFTMIEIDLREVATDEDEAVKKEAEYIKMAKDYGFKVSGEVGKKWPEGDRTRLPDGTINVDETVKEMERFLEAGVDKVVWESLVTKAALGDYAQNEKGAQQIIDVVNEVGVDNIIFEVSSMLPFNCKNTLRWWFVKTFGPEVNFASVRIDEIVSVECIRRGIHPVFTGQQGTSKAWLKSLAENGGKVSPTWWRE